MKSLYLPFYLLFVVGLTWTADLSAQVTATVTAYESRCAATGALKIDATGGSGNYQYKLEGPVTTNFTGEDSITGLSSGVYTLTVNDINTSLTYTKTGITIGGTYADPRFSLDHVDVSCDNGFNGSITVQGLQYGRAPFAYTIVSPSPMGVGTSNASGIFTGLKAGVYNIQLTDSCGGIQTRSVTINNYSWNINSTGFTKTSCSQANGYIYVKDSKGINSQYTPIPGFTYGVVTHAGDTTWTSDGNFSSVDVTGISSLDVLAKDGCGNIKKQNLSTFLKISLNNNVTISNRGCTTFSAAVTGLSNFFGTPQFCLFDVNDVQIGSCQSTGKFDNIPYGSYYIKTTDNCTGLSVIRSFHADAPVAKVDNEVKITNKICADFSASITGKQNLTNPEFCLINSLNGDTLSCNNTGVFDHMAYGDYCIVTKDGCIDTVITRCFSVQRPVPQVDGLVPSYSNCTDFGLQVTGDSLTDPLFCLYDTLHNAIGSCNANGKFDGIPLGGYYVTIHDNCTDTTIFRYINMGTPVISNDIQLNISDKTCTDFTASASSSQLANATFCLYKTEDSSEVACNTTGIFEHLSYGDYYLRSRNECPDTTLVNSFSITRDLPVVDGTVQISNKECATFSATITGQQNLIAPEYCIIDTLNKDTLSCNNNGQFDNLPYGKYLVEIVSGCNDTLRVYFNQDPKPLALNITASRSCYYGFSKFNFSTTGNLPVNIKIYSPSEELVRDRDFNANNFSIDSLPALSGPNAYTIIATDQCGSKDTIQLAPVVGYFDHTPVVKSLCPGSVWLNGSGNLVTSLSSNLPGLSVSIIQKDGASFSKNPDYVAGADYSFNDLGPATYVVRYTASDGCGVRLYDTVTVSPYQYPDLARSKAYQCDVNGFSVGAVVSGGVGPFTYEIIGSSPILPSLIATPQSNPVFNINNGTTYSLVRLRALDACGNASLADASVLPLANYQITATLNCLQSPTTLSVDTIYNATYSWFFKKSENGPDSVAVANGFTYYIPEVLPTDTGIYVCHVKINEGCINRTYYFHLHGKCFDVLPLGIENFSGKFVGEDVQLNWRINNGDDLAQVVIEKLTTTGFAPIGTVRPANPGYGEQNQYMDRHAGNQNYYRLKLVSKENIFSYSNTISLQKTGQYGVSIFPNPALDVLNVGFNRPGRHNYKISLFNLLNQQLYETTFDTMKGNMLRINRTSQMAEGVYILRFLDTDTKEVFSRKVIFNPR